MAAAAEVGEDKYRSFIHGESEKNTVWRYGAPPNYDEVNKLFEERTHVWPEGSLEEKKASPRFAETIVPRTAVPAAPELSICVMAAAAASRCPVPVHVHHTSGTVMAALKWFASGGDAQRQCGRSQVFSVSAVVLQ